MKISSKVQAANMLNGMVWSP